jgi:hypothetical protein
VEIQPSQAPLPAKKKAHHLKKKKALRAACYLRKRDAKEQDLSLDEDPNKIHSRNLQKSKPNHDNNP